MDSKRKSPKANGRSQSSTPLQAPASKTNLDKVSDAAWKLARLCAAYSPGDAAQLFRRDWAGIGPPSDEHPGRALIYDTLSLLFHCQAVVEDSVALDQIKKRASLYSSEVFYKKAHDRISEANVRDIQFYGTETFQRIESDAKFRALAKANGKIMIADVQSYVLPGPKWKNRRSELWEQMVASQGLEDLQSGNALVPLFDAQCLASQFTEFVTAEKRKRARENRRKGASKARKKKATKPGRKRIT